jgi:hypothetical protein
MATFDYKKPFSKIHVTVTFLNVVKNDIMKVPMLSLQCPHRAGFQTTREYELRAT